MNSNKTTYVAICPDRDWYAKYGYQAAFFLYYVFSPSTAVLSFMVHSFYLKAFHTQVKQENGYAYQIITTINDILVMFGQELYVVSYEWFAGPRFGGALWYRTCYGCMIFSKIAGRLLIQTFYTLSLFLIISMSADRMYALWKPLSYKITNTKRIVILSTSICFILSVLLSLMDSFAFTVRETDERAGAWPVYALVLNPSKLGQIWNTIRITIQTLCVPLLYFFSIALLRFYRIRRVEAIRAMNLTRKEERAKQAQKTVALLTICQCVSMTIGVTSNSIAVFAMFLYPNFYTCSGMLILPIREIISHINYIIGLFLAPIISKQFRKMVRRELPGFKDQTTVNAAGTSQMQNRQRNQNRSEPIARQAW